MHGAWPTVRPGRLHGGADDAAWIMWSGKPHTKTLN
jgi:hypothetical protein